MTYYTSNSASLFEIVGLFSATLKQIMALPELALFLGTALLLIIVGVFSWTVRRGRLL